MLTEDSVVLAGMPELLFRAKFAEQVTNASILSDFQSIFQLIEEQSFFLENKAKADLDVQDYINNELLSDQEFILKTALYFNSRYFRSAFTLALLQELAQLYEGLVVVADPLTTHNLAETLRQIKEPALPQEPNE